MLSEGALAPQSPFQQGPPTPWDWRTVSPQELMPSGAHPSSQPDGTSQALILTRASSATSASLVSNPPTQILAWYRILSDDDLSSRAADTYVKIMIDQMGFDVVNQPVLSNGMTLFLHLVKQCRAAPVQSILDISLKTGGIISMLSECSETGKPMNALQISIDMHSPEVVQLILKYGTKGVCEPMELAKMFSESLCRLLEKQELSNFMRFGPISLSFRSVFADTMADRSFLLSLGEVYVPDTVFACPRDPFVVGLHDECCPHGDQSMWNFWQEVYPQMAAITEEEYDHSIKIRAHSFLVPYKDIAHPGKEGILEPMLFMGCQDKVFKSLPVIALIKWKWDNYAFKLGNLQMLKCIILLVVFTMYSTLFMKSLKNETGERNYPLMEILSIASAALAWILFWDEIIQLKNYIQDGATYRHKYYCFLSPSAGLHYWLYTKWNIAEIVSVLSVGVLLPVLHIYAKYTSVTWHSWLVGGTGILLWWKMLYYLQLFEKTSPLVTMIFDIAKDMMAFLSISIFLLVGFALGFIVLFHLEEGEIHDDFSSLIRACFTLFAYLLGAFDLEDFVDTKYPDLAYGIFVIFEVTMTLILLNLLIAIMGDSYDRIKERESTTFLMAKAAIIEDMECINRKKVNRMKIPHYMHILVPSHNCKFSGGEPWWAPQNEAWQGKMVHLERKLRKLVSLSICDVAKRISQATKAIQNRVENIKDRVKESRKLTGSSLVDSNIDFQDAHSHLSNSLVAIESLCNTELQHIQSTIGNKIQQSHPQPNKFAELNISLGAALKNGEGDFLNDMMHVPMRGSLSTCMDQAVAETFDTISSELMSMESSVAGKLDDISRCTEAQFYNLQRQLKSVSNALVTIAGCSNV